MRGCERNARCKKRSKKKKKGGGEEEEGALSTSVEAKACIFLGERIFSIPGDELYPEAETLRLLKLQFRGLEFGWWCGAGFNPMKHTSSSREPAQEMRFIFAKKVIRKKEGEKRPTLMLSIPPRSHVATVPQAAPRPAPMNGGTPARDARRAGCIAGSPTHGNSSPQNLRARALGFPVSALPGRQQCSASRALGPRFEVVTR